MTWPVTYHRTTRVAGVNIFYREAGERGTPVVVLLHGFPSSSHMYRNLIPALADRYHVIAPDLPGFGLSEMPSPSEFEYGFAAFSNVVAGLLEQLSIERYALYVMDYGAPTGFRVALAHPDRVTALIIQNGNAYEEGMGDFWAPTRAYWADNRPASRDAMRPFLSLDGTRFQYLTGSKDEARIDPSSWLYDQLFLDRPGSVEIQLNIHLRLWDQRRALSGISRLSARTSTSDADPVGARMIPSSCPTARGHTSATFPMPSFIFSKPDISPSKTRRTR
jgi:pimeloyl-ACP methyl ester carboxylesterase